MIGGTVALLVEMIVLPVKARDRLVESLATAIRQISKMESSIAFGIEDGRNINGFPPEIFARFEKASNRAMTAFGAAETFCMSLSSVSGIHTKQARKCHFVVQNQD